MENGVQALKIAFGMIIFVFAISITISSFTQVLQAMKTIWEIRQSEEAYVTDASGNYLNYVNFGGGTRIVSAETIVPNMYRAYKENFAIHFYESDGTTPFELYKNDAGKSINYIDPILEIYADKDGPVNHLNVILAKTTPTPTPLYERLAGKKFTEYLGEYYLGDLSGEAETPEANKTKKRVIVYVAEN